MGPVIRVQGEISGEDLPWLKQKKFLKVMDLPARRALQAVSLALQASEGETQKGPEFMGVAVSVESLDSGEREWEEAKTLAQKKSDGTGPSLLEIGNCLPPLALISRLPNSIAGHVAREFGITGPCWTLGGAGGAGLDAVIQAVRWITDGECRGVVVARVEEKAATAIFLGSDPGDKSARRVRSWSVENPEALAGAGDFLKMDGVEDWKDWKNFEVLRGELEGAAIQLVLESK